MDSKKNKLNVAKGIICRKKRYINHLAPSLDKNKVISAEELAFFYEKYD